MTTTDRLRYLRSIHALESRILKAMDGDTFSEIDRMRQRVVLIRLEMELFTAEAEEAKKEKVTCE